MIDRHALAGVALGIVCGALFATAVSSQNAPIAPTTESNVHCWGPTCSSWVELHDPTVEGAVATVTFFNDDVHSRDDSFTLIWPPLEVYFELEWQVEGTAGDERLCAYPPSGYFAAPVCITVSESNEFYIHIYPGGNNS